MKKERLLKRWYKHQCAERKVWVWLLLNAFVLFILSETDGSFLRVIHTVSQLTFPLGIVCLYYVMSKTEEITEEVFEDEQSN